MNVNWPGGERCALPPAQHEGAQSDGDQQQRPATHEHELFQGTNKEEMGGCRYTNASRISVVFSGDGWTDGSYILTYLHSYIHNYIIA